MLKELTFSLAFFLTNGIFLRHCCYMKTITQIDAAGRLVIPKDFRKKYGLEPGQRVRILPGARGVTLEPEHPFRRFIKRGPILTIDTGAGTGPIDAFDVSVMTASIQS